MRGVRRAGFLVAGLAALAGLVIAAVRLARRPEGPPAPPPAQTDPRLTYAGPYRNVRPDVRYVGDAACTDCHKDEASGYARHPMAHSLAPAADLAARQRYTPDAHNPFTALGRLFRVERDGGRVRHHQAVLDDAGRPVAELAPEVRWVIGSGKKGYSYLTERDGYLFQTPISWFSQERRWDLSPGFGPPVLAGRLIPASCLFCHANRLRQHPEHPDRFVPPVFEGHAIGCERCHGPGELHVRDPGRRDPATGADHTIVNPRHLAPEPRDAVCEQCHLEGEARVLRSGRGLFDYRPGLPLHDFWSVLVHADEGGEGRAVTHVEQMYQSRCFRRPVGGVKLGCTTCHNPHDYVEPRRRDSHYRAACLLCHDPAKGQRGCSESPQRRRRTAPPDSCIGCHMPRFTNSDIPHTASTDHRIPRRPAPAHAPAGGGGRFADFYRDRFPGGDPQAERSLGMGLVKMMSGGQLPPERYGAGALRLLESALGQFPQDAELRASKAEALALLGRPAEALPDARAALDHRPGDWRLLALTAAAEEKEGQTDRALADWRRAVEINPFVPEHQAALMALLVRAGRADEARSRCRELLRLDPFNVAGRQAWVGFLLHEGKREEARREFDVIRRLRPADLPRREEWFRQQLR